MITLENGWLNDLVKIGKVKPLLEVGGMLVLEMGEEVGELEEDDGFEEVDAEKKLDLKDVSFYLPEQTVSAAQVDFDVAWLHDFYKQQEGKLEPYYHWVWWHSHNSMGVTPSHTDLKTIKEFVDARGCCTMLITNHKGEYSSKTYLKHCDRYFSNEGFITFGSKEVSDELEMLDNSLLEDTKKIVTYAYTPASTRYSKPGQDIGTSSGRYNSETNVSRDDFYPLWKTEKDGTEWVVTDCYEKFEGCYYDRVYCKKTLKWVTIRRAILKTPNKDGLYESCGSVFDAMSGKFIGILDGYEEETYSDYAGSSTWDGFPDGGRVL